jgi:hypothetical protein
VSSFRWQKLKAALVERRSKLGESQNIQQVTRDAEDIEAWISEKLQSVQDESYMDPSNLQVNTWCIYRNISVMQSVPTNSQFILMRLE